MLQSNLWLSNLKVLPRDHVNIYLVIWKNVTLNLLEMIWKDFKFPLNSQLELLWIMLLFQFSCQIISEMLCGPSIYKMFQLETILQIKKIVSLYKTQDFNNLDPYVVWLYLTYLSQTKWLIGKKKSKCSKLNVLNNLINKECSPQMKIQLSWLKKMLPPPPLRH